MPNPKDKSPDKSGPVRKIEKGSVVPKKEISRDKFSNIKKEPPKSSGSGTNSGGPRKK